MKNIMDIIPSKEEIRRKYGITESDFAVLTESELPQPETLRKEGAWIEKLGYWNRNKFEVWLKRNIIGNILLAVIFIGGVTDGLEAISKYGCIIYASGQQIASYVNNFAWHSTSEAKGFLVHTTQPPTPEDKNHKEWVIFPTTAQIYPVTGSWSLHLPAKRGNKKT